jgi:hypothetical protein
VLMNIRQGNPLGQSETVRERPRCPKIEVVYRVIDFSLELVHPCGQRTISTTPLPAASGLIF